MRCWSCGSDLAGGSRHIFTCPLCRAVEEQKKIRETLEASRAQTLYEAVQISAGLTEIASILEWGFEELEWELGQIRGILGSIDKTLKTPRRTQAKELQEMAGELRRRGLLDDSEKYFLQSLELNPLDYRTYIGLGKTYLQIGELSKARTYWEKSLPHAPKEEIDYKSYSYRLIGRTYFCEENYQQARWTLLTAIELSPRYYLGYYDYAQYCALVGAKESCLSSLQTAVFGEPSLLELAERERNFGSLREEVRSFLGKIKSETEFWVRKRFGTDRFLEFTRIEKEIKEIKSGAEFRIVLEMLGWDSFLEFTQALRDLKEAQKVIDEIIQKYGDEITQKHGDYFVQMLRTSLDFEKIDFKVAREILIERPSGWSTYQYKELIKKTVDKESKAKSRAYRHQRTWNALLGKR